MSEIKWRDATARDMTNYWAVVSYSHMPTGSRISLMPVGGLNKSGEKTYDFDGRDHYWVGISPETQHVFGGAKRLRRARTEGGKFLIEVLDGE